MSVLGSDPDVPVSELLFELPIQEMLYELFLGCSWGVPGAPGASLGLSEAPPEPPGLLQAPPGPSKPIESNRDQTREFAAHTALTPGPSGRPRNLKTLPGAPWGSWGSLERP